MNDNDYEAAWQWAEKVLESFDKPTTGYGMITRFLHLHGLTIEKLQAERKITKNKATRLRKQYAELSWWAILNDPVMKDNERIMAWRRADYANFLLNKQGFKSSEVHYDAIY